MWMEFGHRNNLERRVLQVRLSAGSESAGSESSGDQTCRRLLRLIICASVPIKKVKWLVISANGDAGRQSRAPISAVEGARPRPARWAVEGGDVVCASDPQEMVHAPAWSSGAVRA